VGRQAVRDRGLVSEEDAGVGLGGDGDQVGRGGECGGGERRSTSSIPTPLSNSTSQRIFAAFLVSFAGGGEGVGGDSGASGWGGGGSAGGGSGRIRGARSGDCTAVLTA
jgi:hypothetical protein